MFKAPTDWQKKHEEIIQKTQAYIQSNYWDGIDIYTLRAWLKNFKTDEEKYFSACMLDALVFRTKQMVDSSYRHLASSVIPKFLNSRNIAIPLEIDEWLVSLRMGVKVPFRFIAIETVKGKPGKSGSVVARDIKLELFLARHLVQPPEKIPEFASEVRSIIFIDDFAGTGEQFCDFFNDLLPYLSGQSYSIAYCPLACHEDAKKHIEDTYPNVTVLPVELLTKEDEFFHPLDGSFRGDKKNTVDEAEEFYLNLCEKIGLDGSAPNAFLLGKGGLSLSFAFHLSTPNNNLKLYYHRPDNDSWNHLLQRGK